MTLADWLYGGVGARAGLLYVAAQLVGAAGGAIAANLMFGLPATRP